MNVVQGIVLALSIAVFAYLGVALFKATAAGRTAALGLTGRLNPVGGVADDDFALGRGNLHSYHSGCRRNAWPAGSR